MKKFFSRIGRAKYRIVRLFPYLTIYNLIILIDLNGFRWWYLVLIPVAIFVYWFETCYGIRSELDVAWNNSNEWQEFKKEFNEWRVNISEKRKD